MSRAWERIFGRPRAQPERSPSDHEEVIQRGTLAIEAKNEEIRILEAAIDDLGRRARGMLERGDRGRAQALAKQRQLKVQRLQILHNQNTSRESKINELLNVKDTADFTREMRQMNEASKSIISSSGVSLDEVDALQEEMDEGANITSEFLQIGNSLSTSEADSLGDESDAFLDQMESDIARDKYATLLDAQVSAAGAATAQRGKEPTSSARPSAARRGANDDDDDEALLRLINQKH